MKFQVTMKNPDSVSYAIEEATQTGEATENQIRAALKPWVEYEEYITIEFDTVTKTAVVLKV